MSRAVKFKIIGRGYGYGNNYAAKEGNYIQQERHGFHVLNDFIIVSFLKHFHTVFINAGFIKTVIN